MCVCLFCFFQKIVELKLQLTRFEEGNAYHFEWPVKSSVDSEADQVHRHSQCCSTEGVSSDGATERRSNHLPAECSTKLTDSTNQSDCLIDENRTMNSGNDTEHAPHPTNNCDNELNSTSTDSDMIAGDTTGSSIRNTAVAGHLNSGGEVDSVSKPHSPGDRPNGPGDRLPPLPSVPTSNQCDSAQTDSGVAELKRAPTEVMSPKSYTVFKSSLVHVPEMNLPWGSMRNTTKCECGVTFSYSIRKVRVLYICMCNCRSA